MTESYQDTLFELSDAEPSIEAAVEGDKRTDLERLESVVHELGFVPQSQSELNYATLALDNRDLPGGFARFLNEVLRHQQKSVSEDPQAALLSIIGKIKGFAAEHKGDKKALQLLADEFEPYQGNQHFLSLDKIPELQEGISQPLTRRGINIVLRQLGAVEAFQNGEFASRSLDSYRDDSVVAGKLSNTYRLQQFSETAYDALETIENRYAFWIDCLQQARQHLAARPAATVALKSLGIDVFAGDSQSQEAPRPVDEKPVPTLHEVRDQLAADKINASLAKNHIDNDGARRLVNIYLHKHKRDITPRIQFIS